MDTIYFLYQKDYLKKRPEAYQFDPNGNTGNFLCLCFRYQISIGMYNMRTNTSYLRGHKINFSHVKC
jgi:hypothetical protein